MIVVCLVPCAAMRPQATPTEEASVTLRPSAMTAARPDALKPPEIEEPASPEEQKVEVPHSEAVHDIILEQEPTPDLAPAEPETQIITDPE